MKHRFAVHFYSVPHLGGGRSAPTPRLSFMPGAHVPLQTPGNNGPLQGFMPGEEGQERPL